jgi:CHASE3 domain sensor protein
MQISAISSIMIEDFKNQMAQQEAEQEKAAQELKKALVDDNQ